MHSCYNECLPMIFGLVQTSSYFWLVRSHEAKLRGRNTGFMLMSCRYYTMLPVMLTPRRHFTQVLTPYFCAHHAYCYYRASLSLSCLYRPFATVKIASISTDKVIGVACDVTNEDDVTRTVQKAQQWMGKIDVLVNAAGVNEDTLLVKTERETIMHQLNTNLIGTMFICKAVIKPMIRNRRGCIINMGKCFNLQFYS